ncbi:hypothetical protein SBOR_8147 [Sclerotinia borealis F-4128]|uniref:Copper acquisition factor BIM1-like domain-containing protein n=1 Tax=Sclerotinia borealis (strain F-4128) TaxID=1432307 RepID=W9C6K1_SCLBF|nr:hypothetical protein SBOR_8147 [Sclerotinia borealis F-4128]
MHYRYPLRAGHIFPPHPPHRPLPPPSPRGGQNTISSKRTLWPLAGGSIALDMKDASANVEVLIGYGNDVGGDCNTVFRQTFAEEGMGSFCLRDLLVNGNGMGGGNVTEGMNATIQVVTGGGGMSGGLYNCADITFSKNASAMASAGSCSNATDVRTTAASAKGNPNTTSSSATSSGAASFVGSFGSVGLMVVGIVVASMWRCWIYHGMCSV